MSAHERDAKALSAGMRRLLYAAAVLVFLAGVQLFVFPTRTDVYFAWTIKPPLTAVFLGASYWSSVAFEWTAARQRRWADARIAVPTVLVFTVLTLVVTLVHLDRFHLGHEFEPRTQAVTWLWLAVYSIVPVLMIGLMVAQARVAGGEPPRSTRPPAWMTAVVVAQAAGLLGIGAALLIVPLRAAKVWPWELTPLTGRAIGAWVFSLGVAASHALWEREERRLRPAAAAYVVFGFLQLIALARHPDVRGWRDASTLVYLVFLASTVVVGGAVMSRQRPTRPAP